MLRVEDAPIHDALMRAERPRNPPEGFRQQGNEDLRVPPQWNADCYET